MSEETIEKTYQVETHALLKVENIRGTVDIRPGDENLIKITATKHLNTGNNAKTEIILEQNNDGTVCARVISEENGLFDIFTKFNKPCKVDFVIKTPQDCEISVKNISSSATLSQLKGILKLKTISGPLNLQELSGKLDAGTISGVINGQELDSETEIDSVSGKIDFRQCNFPTLIISTVSDNTFVETPVNQGPFELKSVSGEVTLIVGPEAKCTVSTRSLSGRFKTSLPTQSYSSRAGKTTTEINGGGSLVKMESVSGNLILLASEGDIATIPYPDRKPRKDRIEILTKVESGDLSVEEALTKLA
ncbi:MAG: hypothetical protein FVQ83_02530 [Chloroflexi bacterium]|nr:hypothetical protein [Chloroflexota bacterium]